MAGSGTPADANCMKKGAALGRGWAGVDDSVVCKVFLRSCRSERPWCACLRRVLKIVFCSLSRPARLALLWMDTQAFNWNSLELRRLGYE